MLRISVVIPLYNKAPHIGRAIRSVLLQTEPDYEVIVVDDGSTDDGAAIVAGLLARDSRLKLVRQENQGVSAARNRGIAEACSDFIAFLDADDEWEADHLETLLRLRETFPDAGACATAYSYVNTRGKPVPAKFRGAPPAPWEGILPDYFVSVSLGEPPVTGSTAGIPRSVFAELGLFRVGEKMGEDLDLWGRIALQKPVAFSWKGSAVYHMEAEGRPLQDKPVEKELPFVETATAYFKGAKMPRSVLLHVNQLRLRRIDSLLLVGRKKEVLQGLLRMNLLVTKPYTLAKTLAFLVLPKNISNLAKKLKRKLWRI
jgi:GT2 family glycosyltransferase